VNANLNKKKVHKYGHRERLRARFLKAEVKGVCPLLRNPKGNIDFAKGAIIQFANKFGIRPESLLAGCNTTND